MATPASLRSRQEALTRLATNDLAAMWRQVSNAAEANVALNDVLPALLDTYGNAASAVAADWYDEARAVAGVGGSFRAIPAEIRDSGAAELAGWATAKGTSLDSIRVLAEGGAQRRILNYSRRTVMGSALADPRADGWQRIGVGSCEFCAMLIGRGAVYSEESADFLSHDHCHCAAAPAFLGAPKPADQPIEEPPAPEVAFQEKQEPREAISVEQAAADPANASGFTPEDLRNALDPSRKRSATAIVKELETTPAGRDLAAEIKRFTETRGGVANLRKNIEKTLEGTASDAVQARAQAFIDAVNTYPSEDVPKLFRGFAVKVEENTAAWWDAFEGQFQPGQKFSLNASSFSSSEKKAAEFSRMIGGTRKASSNYTAVRMELEGGQALPVETLSKFKSEKEWITGGDFEVVGYERATPAQPYYKVIVRQTKKLGAP